MASKKSDAKPGAGRPPEKAALIAELAGARAGMREGGAELAQKLDARQRLEHSIKERPLLWAGGAAAAGFALALLVRGGGSSSRSAPAARPARSSGITSAIGSGIASALKPALAKYAQETLKNALGGTHQGAQDEDSQDA